MKRILVLAALLAFMTGISNPALAFTTTGNMSVSATLQAACSLTVTNINLGNITPATTGTTPISVDATCSSGVNYNVTMDAGANSGVGASRFMVDSPGTSRARYIISKNGVCGTGQWADSDFANTYSLGASCAAVGTGLAQTLTGYISLMLASGSGSNLINFGAVHSDTVTVTLNY